MNKDSYYYYSSSYYYYYIEIMISATDMLGGSGACSPRKFYNEAAIWYVFDALF